jgi:hypothetical protein
MYYLIEDSPSGLTIIKEFYNLEEAKQEKHVIECSESGNWCAYYITKLLTNEDV